MINTALRQGHCREYSKEFRNVSCREKSNVSVTSSIPSSSHSGTSCRKEHFLYDAAPRYISDISSKSSYSSPPYRRSCLKNQNKIIFQEPHQRLLWRCHDTWTTTGSESNSRRCFTPQSRRIKRLSKHRKRLHKYPRSTKQRNKHSDEEQQFSKHIKRSFKSPRPTKQYIKHSDEEHQVSTKELILFYHHKLHKKNLDSAKKHSFYERDQKKRMSRRNVTRYIDEIKSRYLSMCEEELDCGCPIIKQRLYRTTSRVSFCSQTASESSRSRSSKQSLNLSSSSSWYSRSQSSGSLSSVTGPSPSQASLNCFSFRSTSPYRTLSDSVVSSSSLKTNAYYTLPKRKAHYKDALPLHMRKYSAYPRKFLIGTYSSYITQSENNLSRIGTPLFNTFRQRVLEQHEEESHTTSEVNDSIKSTDENSDTGPQSWISSILTSLMPAGLVNLVGRFRKKSIDKSQSKRKTTHLFPSEHEPICSSSSNDDCLFNVSSLTDIHRTTVFLPQYSLIRNPRLTTRPRNVYYNLYD